MWLQPPVPPIKRTLSLQQIIYPALNVTKTLGCFASAVFPTHAELTAPDYLSSLTSHQLQPLRSQGLPRPVINRCRQRDSLCTQPFPGFGFLLGASPVSVLYSQTWQQRLLPWFRALLTAPWKFTNYTCSRLRFHSRHFSSSPKSGPSSSNPSMSSALPDGKWNPRSGKKNNCVGEVKRHMDHLGTGSEHRSIKGNWVRSW